MRTKKQLSTFLYTLVALGIMMLIAGCSRKYGCPGEIMGF